MILNWLTILVLNCDLPIGSTIEFYSKTQVVGYENLGNVVWVATNIVGELNNSPGRRS
jgi:hypothetical protein